MEGSGVELSGAVAIVTGAGSGIGEAIAREFSVRGCTIVAVDRAAERLPGVVEACTKGAPGSYSQTADVSSRAECEALVAAAAERLGRIDVLVNNAGVPLHKSAADTTVEDIEQVMDVNFFGA